ERVRKIWVILTPRLFPTPPGGLKKFEWVAAGPPGRAERDKSVFFCKKKNLTKNQVKEFQSELIALWVRIPPSPPVDRYRSRLMPTSRIMPHPLTHPG